MHAAVESYNEEILRLYNKRRNVIFAVEKLFNKLHKC